MSQAFTDVLKITFILACGVDLLNDFISLDRICNDKDPRNGKIMLTCFFGTVIFKTSVKLGSYFRFKDIFPSSLRSHVIYKYKCHRCNSTYVGKTKRYWEKRLEEHLSISALTGKPLKTFKVWPPKEHDVTCACSISRDSFSLIGGEQKDFLLYVKESLMIYRLNPNLNIQSESTKLFLFN